MYSRGLVWPSRYDSILCWASPLEKINSELDWFFIMMKYGKSAIYRHMSYIVGGLKKENFIFMWKRTFSCYNLPLAIFFGCLLSTGKYPFILCKNGFLGSGRAGIGGWTWSLLVSMVTIHRRGVKMCGWCLGPICIIIIKFHQNLWSTTFHPLGGFLWLDQLRYHGSTSPLLDKWQGNILKSVFFFFFTPI